MTTRERDRTLLLAGMMGAGKSSVGKLLAARLGRPFIDTDDRIAARAGRSLPEIFAGEGEAGFRARERAVLAELPESGAVIALGGGAPVADENRRLLRGKGVLVWLDARPETLAQRVGEAAGRPLLAGLDGPGRTERLRHLREERASAYAGADLRVETDGRTPEEVCAEVLRALGWERAA
jgi:shikimate kinase